MMCMFSHFTRTDSSFTDSWVQCVGTLADWYPHLDVTDLANAMVTGDYFEAAAHHGVVMVVPAVEMKWKAITIKVQ